MIPSLFKGLCPNCGGEINSQRLQKGIPCEKCLPQQDADPCKFIKAGNYKEICRINEDVQKWEKHFENHLKLKPWSLQKTWAKRVFSGISFALLAPTGVGKTSFGISVASYLAKENKKSYIIVPTKLLVEQVCERLKDFGLKDEILAFNEITAKLKERLKKENFKVLVTTSMFLYKNQEILPRNFSFIFVDDVDSFLKTAKNVDKVLHLLGFCQSDIAKAFELILLKAKAKKTDTDWEKIKEIQKELDNVKNYKKGVLVISSATTQPRSNRVKLFRELLGFEVGTPTFYLRNVVDAFTEEGSLVEWIKKLGKGGLVFLSSDKGREAIDEIMHELKKNGIKAASYETLNNTTISRFEKGKIDVLVGIASYKNPLARGFDMPHVVRYALFYGVPKIVISLKFESNLNHLLWAVSSIRSFIVKKLPEYTQKINSWISQLRKYQHLNFVEVKPSLKQKIENLTEEIGKFLSSKEVLDLLNSSDEITLKFTKEGYFMTVSDATGYLQASGRTSRMYAGGITKGLSLILVDDRATFKHLAKKVRWFNDEIKFLSVSEIDLDSTLKEIDEDRIKIKEFLNHRKFQPSTDLLKPVLIIVESPNKAKTIANFFGKPVRRKVFDHDIFETSIEDRYIMITSSYGHILDLVKNEAFYGVLVDKEIVPIYEAIEGKEPIIKSIRKIAIEAEQILIATDPDTEGEKISWDIHEILKPYVSDIKRMEFHEVTKKAIIRALKEPRDFNLNLVKAQVVRRIADRWVGFEFSQLLQKNFGKQTLSAGRVQTPVLGWIIDREKNYREKIYKVLFFIERNNKKLRVSFDFEDKQEAINFFNSIKEVQIEIVSEEEKIELPQTPYRTDTMLKDAGDFYKFSLPKTMQLAQTLFELGFITYHRTDSQRVSDAGINVAKEFIKEEFGLEYFSPRNWAEGGAHECIRPTKSIEPEELNSMLITGQIEGLSKEHLLLYEMIFKRFIASQMKPVKSKYSEMLIKALNKEQKINLRTEIIEDGWNRILKIETYPEIKGIFNVENTKQFKQQPKVYPYTYSELVAKMKEKGIGRPSTYASIVEKLVERKYVIDSKGFLIPTELGKAVYSYLNNREKIKNFVSEDFTQQLEAFMDKVEEGMIDYKTILYDLYRQIIGTRTH
ncbi:MAG: reverse gyrase [Thermodesulfovibrio sp.]|uniref:Reverse gyrase n=1 Tax=Thermodesulfovibrio aggregans TaxID=86166 RepID=A0A2J6WGX8_9BACT|nr:MAG: reverse gyrase [Thermodesulfovibrio aggregans]